MNKPYHTQPTTDDLLVSKLRISWFLLKIEYNRKYGLQSSTPPCSKNIKTSLYKAPLHSGLVFTVPLCRARKLRAPHSTYFSHVGVSSFSCCYSSTPNPLKVR